MSRNIKPEKTKVNLDSIDAKREIRFNENMAKVIMYLRKAQAECKVGRGLEGVVSETLDKALDHLQGSLAATYRRSLTALCDADWRTIKQAIELSCKPIGKRVLKKKPVSKFKRKRSVV